MELTEALADVDAAALQTALGNRRAERVLLKTRNSLRSWEREPFQASC